MSIWAGKHTQAALAAASSRAGIQQRFVDVDSVQIKVIAGLERLSSTINTLKSGKPELQRASELLLACTNQVKQAIQPATPKQDDVSESARHSLGM